MAILQLNLWPFKTMKKCPVAKNAKVGIIVCQILNKPSKKLPKYFENVAKVVKFRQIWSHCLQPLNSCWHHYLSVNLFTLTTNK